ncbi:hypothetical protein VKT23_015155 [Stygiomarasmius scandens]|uniref:Uncharacterized protein n=1 Tax=Marasmiellus scandens TaxID=2682957 RepID=A0ABR1IZ17_9AGAR
MQFNFVFVAVALLASASPAVSSTVKWFKGADCTGRLIETSLNAQDSKCVSLGRKSARSIHYADVEQHIHFFISGGLHDNCTNGASLTRQGTGCANAPDGHNWESISVN